MPARGRAAKIIPEYTAMRMIFRAGLGAGLRDWLSAQYNIDKPSP